MTGGEHWFCMWLWRSLYLFPPLKCKDLSSVMKKKARTHRCTLQNECVACDAGIGASLTHSLHLTGYKQKYPWQPGLSSQGSVPAGVPQVFHRVLVQTEGQRTGYQCFSISRDECLWLKLSKLPALGRRPEPRAQVHDGSVASRCGQQLPRSTGSAVVLAQTPQLGHCNPLGVSFPLSLHLVRAGQGQTFLSSGSHLPPALTQQCRTHWQVHLERRFGVCIPPPCPTLRCASLKQDRISFCFPHLEAILGQLIYWEISAGLSLKIWGGLKNFF